MTQPAYRLIALLAAVALSGCVYKIDVQQGNVVEEDEVTQLEVGMDERQVRFLLGDPIAGDAFRDDRWTYVYYFRSDNDDIERKGQLIVHWDADRKVARVERTGQSMQRMVREAGT